MSSLELDQVLYARAGWRKAILVPLWTFQIAVLLCLMGVFAYRLAETFDHYEENDKLGQVPIVEVVWEATNVGFNLIALILNILEIARKATERLTPFMMLCTHVIKLTLAFAVLALDIVAYLQRMDGHYSTIGLSLDCGLLAATLTTFIYALVTYRRLLRYEDYHITLDATAQGHGQGDNAVELGYNGKPRSHITVTTTTTATTTTTTTTAPDFRYDPTYPSQTRHLPHFPPASTNLPAPASTRPSEPHTLPSPTDAAALKKVVDRAIGAEFGWGGESPVASAAAGVAAGPVNRSGSVVVASGKVPVHHGMVAAPATADLLQRQRSWVTERGVIAEVDEGPAAAEDREDDDRGGGSAAAAVVVMGRDMPAGGERGGHADEDRERLLSGR